MGAAIAARTELALSRPSSTSDDANCTRWRTTSSRRDVIF